MYEEEDYVANLPHSPSKKRNEKRKFLRKGSVSENFFVVKGQNLIIPCQSPIACSNVQLVRKYGGELQVHLKAIFGKLRDLDGIKMVVRLESMHEDHCRYLVIIKTIGRQDTEENVIIGCDFESTNSVSCTIGMVLPIWSVTQITLDGDGGFKVILPNKCNHTFKPVSVQAMWCSLQCLYECRDNALANNYYEGSLYLTWTDFYRIESTERFISEWQHNDDLWSSRIEYLGHGDPQIQMLQAKLRIALKEVMSSVDLDNCTSRQIRQSVEKKLNMNLNNHKKLVDQEMFKIMGQLETSSKILDHLYLGSEWNAMHREGLKELNVTHILNVTIEIDNFYPKEFQYERVGLLDLPSSDLLSYWHSTCKFIKKVKDYGGVCLVHCKMGISRSVSTVVAYLIKENKWSKEQAMNYVKSCRPIANPNEGFMKQLDEWEGMIFASANRHNELFRNKSDSDLSEQDSIKSGSKPKEEDFDLNRRLLDLRHLTSSTFSRPKSWSPEDRKRKQTKRKNTQTHHIGLENSNESLPEETKKMLQSRELSSEDQANSGDSITVHTGGPSRVPVEVVILADPIAVRDRVANFEAPKSFRKGHQKTLSLPPEIKKEEQFRGRAYSEIASSSVKQIITAIEHGDYQQQRHRANTLINSNNNNSSMEETSDVKMPPELLSDIRQVIKMF